MTFLLSSILLTIGFIVLWIASDKAIAYCAQIAQLFGISRLFVGFVLLAVSTGLPELMVAVQAFIADTPTLSVGNIIGSNFADIALAIGISALFIGPIAIVPIDYYEQVVMFAISSAVMGMVFINGAITQAMGYALVALYIGGIIVLWYVTHNEPHEHAAESVSHTKRNGILVRLGLYLFLVIASSKLCVDQATVIASYLAIPLDVLGVSIFALGTSLPEISLNIQAVRQKRYSLALGNSLGSTFIQGAFILGMQTIAASRPLPLDNIHTIMPFMVCSYALIAYHLIMRKTIGKLTGALLVLCYCAFIIYEYMLYS